MKHLLSAEQLTWDVMKVLFDKADCIRNQKPTHMQGLYAKIVATLFYEPSTRTRLSFESAALRLGAQILSTENAKEMSSAIKGETLFDTLRVLEGYADAIVIRHHDNYEMMNVADKINVPIINAGAGSGEHPTQALLDAYTIYCHYNRLDNLKICVIGDLLFGRTIHSLVKLMSQFANIEIYALSPELLHLPDEYIEYMRDHNVQYIKCDSIADIPSDIDVMYCTRTQSERFKDVKEIKEIVIDLDILNRFEKVIVMHPLPRNSEIAAEVDSSPKAVYFEQAKNGMYVRMALLDYLINENGDCLLC